MAKSKKRHPHFKKGPSSQIVDQVGHFIVEHNNASHGPLKKKFGFNDQQCRKVLDVLEQRGIVGPKTTPTIPRKIRVGSMGSSVAPLTATTRGRPRIQKDIVSDFIRMMPAVVARLQEMQDAESRLNNLLAGIANLAQPPRKRGRPKSS